MKKLPRWFKDIFSPKELHGLDVQEILAALSEEATRKLWMYETFQELKRMNLDIDKRLITGQTFRIDDLAARRKAYQDMLDGILSARRQLRTHNLRPKSGEFDLDSVTVGSAYL
jgi:hypothetical protein